MMIVLQAEEADTLHYPWCQIVNSEHFMNTAKHEMHLFQTSLVMIEHVCL